MKEDFKPYIPSDTRLPECTFKAVFLGILMAVVLGAANAWLGLKAGMTISAAFPAAVIAIAAFRLPFMRGNILEQNIARTTASVGEALAAGAIFTIPAFMMIRSGDAPFWKEIDYLKTTPLLLVGGVLGVLFIVVLRRTLVVDADLPFPEGVACYEITRAGQKGESGARYVFGALGVGMLIEFFKNSTGMKIIEESVEFVIRFPKSIITHFDHDKVPIGKVVHEGGLVFSTPLASPALMGVGYIVGPRIAAVNFSGGLLAWLVFIPLAMFLNPELRTQLGSLESPLDYSTLSYTIWYNNIRPMAVGAMLVGSFYTLWGLRSSLIGAFRGIFRRGGTEVKSTRTEQDLNLRWVFLTSLILIIPMVFIFGMFTHHFASAIVAAIVMAFMSFLFAAVGGWLVGIVGNSNQPVSGLTLTTLIIAAIIMVALGEGNVGGIAAVLAVATVVCCVACIAGDMIQDLKVGHLLGGTPWKMELAEIFGVIAVALLLVFPIMVLHKGTPGGIGGTELPAPQAGLMAQLATGIVGGVMPWGLVLIGMFFSLGLILIKAPSPMLIAVGMYLPFETTFAIFVGGVIKWIADSIAKKRLKGEEMTKYENKGILLASGFIAGEALTGVILAALYAIFLDNPEPTRRLSSIGELLFGKGSVFTGPYSSWLALVIFAIVMVSLVWFPLRGNKEMRGEV